MIRPLAGAQDHLIVFLVVFEVFKISICSSSVKAFWFVAAPSRLPDELDARSALVEIGRVDCCFKGLLVVKGGGQAMDPLVMRGSLRAKHDAIGLARGT